MQPKYMMAAAVTFIICILMMVCAETAVLAAKKGISLWVSNVLPAMLPFFICINFISGTGIMNLLPANLFPFAMSIMSGYPMGAKIVGDMCRTGQINKREAMRLASFCSTSGPVFIIGAVGVGMLGSQQAGYVIALSHYLGAIANGLIYSKILGVEHVKSYTKSRLNNLCLMDQLSKSVFSACKSLVVILAYIIFSMFLLDMTLGAFEADVWQQITLKGIVEMTVGCSSVAGAGLPLKRSCTWTVIMISWSGLSIIGQSLSMLSGTGISFAFVLITKLTHAIFSGIISLFLGELML